MCILTEIMYVTITSVLSWESASLVFCTGKSRSVQYNRILIWDDENEAEALFRIYKWGSLGFDSERFPRGEMLLLSTYGAVLSFTFTVLSIWVLLFPLCLMMMMMMMMMIKASWDIPVYNKRSAFGLLSVPGLGVLKPLGFPKWWEPKMCLLLH